MLEDVGALPVSDRVDSAPALMQEFVPLVPEPDIAVHIGSGPQTPKLEKASRVAEVLGIRFPLVIGESWAEIMGDPPEESCGTEIRVDSQARNSWDWQKSCIC